MSGITTLLVLGASQSTPLLLACLGGLLSESSGVINFALEGMMLTGAFMAVWATHATGSPWAGLLAGAAAGMAVGIVHAVVCLGFRAHQIVSSIALNLLAAGLTAALVNHVFGVYGTTPTVSRLPTLGNCLGRLTGAEPPLTGALGSLSVLVPGALLACLLVWVLLAGTSWGLAIRSCGENPEAASSTGLKVSWIRFGAVAAGGVFAGMGGAFLSIGELAHFVELMTQGRGYLAVAALILGRWKPGGALGAVLLFGFAEALSQWLAVRWVQWPPQVFLAFPYVLSLGVLFTSRGRRHGPPSALGRL